MKSDKSVYAATNEMFQEVLSNRNDYISQFNINLSPDEIASIASDNFIAGVNHAFSSLKVLLDTSLEDYDYITRVISPVMDSIEKEAIYKTKLREKQSLAGKNSSELRNRKYKEMYKPMQDQIERILSNGGIKSYNAACCIVAKIFNVHPDTVKKNTANPKSKHK
jgi:hypothetical protein